MDSERFIATKPEGPKLINGNMIYTVYALMNDARINESTFIRMEKSVLGLSRKAYISLWNKQKNPSHI